LGGGTIDDIVNGIISGGITGAILGPLAMVNRLRPVLIAFGLGSGVKGVYDSLKNGEYDQAAFRAVFVISTLWSLKKGMWDKSSCFTEETLVLTQDGYNEIKDIQEGDLVYSENVETCEKGLKKVAKVFVREVRKLVHVFVDGEEIKTTDTHPFWVEGIAWIEAGDLKAGDVLRLYTGELKTIDKVNIRVFDRPVKVYNFEVEDWHTYFVSDESVLVHNAKDYDGNGNSKPKKGKEFRGGSKKQRDNWYGYKDKNFQKWWERQGKKYWGGADIEDSKMAKEVYDYWVEIGSPSGY
ncbi:MAG: hypothetical protein GX660_01520, partial [Clostridiaceae bacterium]|nr:hypothetical protein [Clostridiaceae bacterium]